MIVEYKYTVGDDKPGERRHVFHRLNLPSKMTLARLWVKSCYDDMCGVFVSARSDYRDYRMYRIETCR